MLGRILRMAIRIIILCVVLLLSPFLLGLIGLDTIQKFFLEIE